MATKVIAILNQKLSTLMLTDVDLEDIDDFLATTTTRDGAGNITEVSYRLGFDGVTLVCVQVDSDEPHIFKISTAAYPRSEGMDTDKFRDAFQAEHPEVRFRTIWHIEYDQSQADGFIVIYYVDESVTVIQPTEEPVVEIISTEEPAIDVPPTEVPAGNPGGFADFFANPRSERNQLRFNTICTVRQTKNAMPSTSCSVFPIKT